MSVITIGESAPSFTLTGLDGKAYSLDRNGERLTLAVFFKTTCPTCKLSWPYVETLYQQYRHAGLAVWGISPDARDLSAEYASKYGSTFPILLDADWEVSRAFDPEFVPTMLLIDENLTIVDSVVGFAKAGLNHLAQVSAIQLGAAPAVIAPSDDGNPPFKPG